MKKFLCIVLLLSLVLVLASCGSKSKKKSNEELIEERVNEFISAYNSGDIDGVIACLDRQTGTTVRSTFNILSAFGGAMLGVDLSLSDLFALGVAIEADEDITVNISSIKIGDKKAVVTASSNVSNFIYFTLKYENDGWFINDITDYKPEGIIEDNEDASEPLADVDESFLTETKASEGLTYELSNDKSYYILTSLGDCDDSHIVLPEYPSEYNEVPLKEISCSLDSCTYVTIPKTVNTIKDSFSGEIVAINYLGSLSDFCNINFKTSGWYGADENRFDNKVIYLNGTPLIGNLIITSDIKSIPAYLFAGYDKITSVNISSDISIGEYAFTNCSSLTDVAIKSQAEICYNAFSECSSLTNVTISGNTEIGTEAFIDCEKLSAITLGDDISSIGYAAFFNTAYTTTSSNWTKGLLYIGNHLYSAREDVINATVKEGTVGIACSIFSGHKNLTTITLPASLKYIGSSAFYDTSSLSLVKYDGYATDWNQISIGENNNSLTAEKIMSSKSNLPIMISVLEFNGHTYAVFTHINNWTESKAFCESVGGHLVTFSSKSENEAVYNFMRSLGISMAHIGMSDAEEEGVWKWVTGEAMDYTNWDEGEPNGASTENYGCFWKDGTDGTWNDTSEEYYNYRYGSMSFICEWDF